MSAFGLPPPSPYLDDVIYEQPLRSKGCLQLMIDKKEKSAYAGDGDGITDTEKELFMPYS